MIVYTHAIIFEYHDIQCIHITLHRYNLNINVYNKYHVKFLYSGRGPTYGYHIYIYMYIYIEKTKKHLESHILIYIYS